MMNQTRSGRMKAGSRGKYLLKVITIAVGICLVSLLSAQLIYAHELSDVKKPGFAIFGEKYDKAGPVNSCDNRSFGRGSLFNVQFSYDDPSGQVTDASRIAVEHSGAVEESVEPSHEISIMDTYPYITRTGDRFKGTVMMQWCVTFQGRNSTLVRFQLKNAAGEYSNKSVDMRIMRPEGAM